MNELKILLIDNGQSFDLQTPYENPLGGSETSLVLLGKGLAELGHSVVILTSKNDIKIDQNQNPMVAPNSLLDHFFPDADIIVLNRFLPLSIFQNKRDKIVFYYTHDAFDQPLVQWMIDPRLVSFFDYVLFVSEWQKQTFIKYFNLKGENLEVLPNSLDLSLYFGYVGRNEKRLIFPSIPFKGIDVLPDLFRAICEKVKDDSLELHVFSSMSLYGEEREQENRQYEYSFSRLQRMPGVFLHEPVSMKQLAVEFMRSSLFIHPCTYHETFGMNVIQAQASGCVPFVVNNGAVGEVVESGKTGFITKGRNIWNEKVFQEMVDLVCEFLQNGEDYRYSMRLKCRESIKKYHYLNVAKKFLSFLEGD